MSKPELCDTCNNCLIKTYPNNNPGIENKMKIKTCLITMLDIFNDFIKHEDHPIECNKYSQIKTK